MLSVSECNQWSLKSTAGGSSSHLMRASGEGSEVMIEVQECFHIVFTVASFPVDFTTPSHAVRGLHCARDPWCSRTLLRTGTRSLRFHLLEQEFVCALRQRVPQCSEGYMCGSVFLSFSCEWRVKHTCGIFAGSVVAVPI